MSTEESQSEGGQSGDLSDPAEYSAEQSGASPSEDVQSLGGDAQEVPEQYQNEAEQSIGNKRKLNDLSGSEYSGEQSEKKK